MRKTLFCTLAALALSSGAAVAEMSLSFDWGNIPACNTGKPNTVGSPRFVVAGVPQGTTSVEFRLKDLDAPRYKHGGGKVAMTGDGVVPFGAFKYKSPCPPRQVHTYQWTATAHKGKTVLAKATAQRRYPE